MILRTLVRLGATATLVAGVVGILRQRREAIDVSEGRLPRASAAADVPAQVQYGFLARRVAAWVPTRVYEPASPVGRLWVAPLTALGLLVATVAGSRPLWRDDLGCYVATDVGGPSRFLLRRLGMTANTIGQVVLVTSKDPSPELLAHEAVHVRQGERLGLLLVPAYLWFSARYGYRDNPFERAARLGAVRATAGQREPGDGDQSSSVTSG